MFNDLASPLSYLASRRSGKPRDMVAPGPDDTQLAAMLGMAARTPDHGKLTPWRFVVVTDRAAFAAMLVAAYRIDKPDATTREVEAVEQFAHQAPTLVVVLSVPNHASSIPLWEQRLSTGAVCMNLLHAAHAHGFVGGWLTGWATYSTAVRDSLGSQNEQVAGFMFIGTPSRPLDERPRPNVELIVREWPQSGLDRSQALAY